MKTTPRRQNNAATASRNSQGSFKKMRPAIPVKTGEVKESDVASPIERIDIAQNPSDIPANPTIPRVMRSIRNCFGANLSLIPMMRW